MKKSLNNRKGFVLLLVLAVLVIVSVVLSSWAYRTSTGALYAGEVSRDIQRKWGNLSCRQVMLASAEDILNEDSKESKDGPVSSAVREIELCGMTYSLVLSDEQAKMNINFLIKNADRQQVIEQLHRFMSDMKNPPQMQLSMDAKNVEYTTLEQLFDCGDDPEKLMAVNRLTCYGSGLVNFNRADKKTLIAVGTGVLNDTDIEKILTIRKEKPDGSLDELIKSLSLSDKPAERLKKILTDKSACKGLWVVCHDNTRNWYQFYVNSIIVDDKDKKTSSMWSYQW